jgi:hypothetical protein
MGKIKIKINNKQFETIVANINNFTFSFLENCLKYVKTTNKKD